MGNVLGSIEPKAVWHYFEAICNVPHPSKKEEKIAAYIMNWGKEKGFEVITDKLGNIVVRKPATPGMENRKPIAIQGHIDMVCEKNSDVEFDFDNDPIQPYIDGDWVKARGTTLGADNGIGVAMGMALMDSKDLAHPDLEILCTLDEETGLTGAIQLATNLLKAEILINLDSEEEDAFTIGCAGGINTAASFKYIADKAPTDATAYKITVKGLRGGHSGIEIHDGRANAAMLLNRALYNLQNTIGLRLVDFNSGNKHNAIPREGFATVVVPNSAKNDFEKYIADYCLTAKKEYAVKEPNLNIFAEACAMPAKVMEKAFQKNLLNSFYAMPHGVIRMSPDIAGLVQTSTNFAIVETRAEEVYVLTSQRSSVESEKVDIAHKVRASLELGGATVESSDGYPAWEPNVKSPILAEAVKMYEKVLGKKPEIMAIHAGLECGLIGEKYPGMDMLSMGPNLRDVHSPDEKVQISSVEKIWKLLVEIVKHIPEKK